MLRNNKGFTVIELIMSFLFASILAISLFSVIVTYRDKQTDTSIETDILAFKSQLVMDVQEDIQLRGLKSIDNCVGSGENPILPRCVILNFNDDTTKMFSIGTDLEVVDEGVDQFQYYVPYIVYGDIRYDIPDAANVYIDDDYILQKTGPTDGIESGTVLYKINFNLKHSDLDTDVGISIVANGTLSTSTSNGPYKVYNIGDEVYIQLNSSEQKKFRVIQFSNSYKDNLTLLYDDVYDTSSECNSNFVCNSINFNILDNISNRYDSSIIKNKVERIENNWFNVDLVRLITVDEVSRVAALCPLYKGADASNISLSSSPSWLTNKTFWTSSEKEESGNDIGKKVWYVNGSNRTLSFDYVNVNHTLRPVIVVKKIFVTN